MVRSSMLQDRVDKIPLYFALHLHAIMFRMNEHGQRYHDANSLDAEGFPGRSGFDDLKRDALLGGQRIRNWKSESVRGRRITIVGRLGRQ